MKRTKVALFAAAVAAVAILLDSCPNPLQEVIAGDVAAKYPHIVVRWHDGTAIASGDIWDVGGTVAGVAKDVVLTVKNEGEGTLSLTGDPTVVIGGTDADAFTLFAPPGSSVLPAGGSTTFTVRFISSVLGSKTATVAVQSDDAGAVTYSITLVGLVTAIPVPEIVVRQDSTDIASGTGAYDFVTAYEGSSEDVTFTVENVGTADLHLDADPISVSGEHRAMFAIPVLPASSTLAVGETATFTVRFSPTGGAGTKTATLGIASDDADENPFVFALSSTITPEIDITVGSVALANGGSHDFTPGGLAYRTFAVDAVFTISNPGRANLELTGTPEKVAVSGYDGQVQFSVTSQPTSPVPAHGSVSFTVRYLASNLSTSEASVAVASSDSDESTYSFGVTGAARLALMVRRLAAGEGYTLAVKPDGTVWAWGSNGYGRLGDGTADAQRAAPVQVLGLTGVTAVAACQYHSVALRNDGTVWTWGRNNEGQLGNGTTSWGESTPVQVTGLTDVAGIAAGDQFTVAVTSNGSVWSWGYGTNGRLGTGSQNSSSVPVRITGLSNVMAVGAGYYHGVALLATGSAYAWGGNSGGQIGNEWASTFVLSPMSVTGLTGATEIAVGCMHNIARMPDGTLWAWGSGSAGQLGFNLPDPPSAAQVPGMTNVAAISAGFAHTIVRKSDGSLWACGYNINGQLGWDTLGVNVTTFTQVPSFTASGYLASGNIHSLSMDDDGIVWAWGDNAYGQLGDGTTDDRLAPVRVSVLSPVAAVSIGSNHTLALRSDGTTWAWGRGINGRLGDNTGQDQTTAVQVLQMTSVTQIAAGGSHSIALKGDGRVWAWGYNSDGQLGVGSIMDWYVAVVVSGITGVNAIAAGGLHTLALKLPAGDVWAWGANADGQLGWDTMGADQLTPAQVPSFTGASALAAGSAHTVALVSGEVWAWGRNADGQLGWDTSGADQLTPAKVPSFTGVAAIAAGSAHTVALVSGEVWAWGANVQGQLGWNTSGADQLTPAKVPSFTGVAAIAAAGDHTVAIKTDGTVWCWGDNAYGQLGTGDNPTDHNTPTQVTGVTAVGGAVAAGWYDCMVVNADGSRVWVWGRNQYGELGDGTKIQRNAPSVGAIRPLKLQ